MAIPLNLYQLDLDGNPSSPSANVAALWPAVENFQREFLRQNRSPNTILEYGYDLTAFVAFLDQLNISSWAAVTKDTIREFLHHLRLLNDLAPTTLNRRLASLRSFFKFLVEENVLEQNPATLVRKAKMPRNTAGHVYLTAHEAKQLLTSVQPDEQFAQRDQAMLALMLFCGLRVSEVSTLNIDNVKRGDMVLTVHGKGNKIREIPLESVVLKFIDHYLAVRPAAKLKKAKSRDEEEPLSPSELSPISSTPPVKSRKQNMRDSLERQALFLSRNYTRITPRAIRMLVDKYMKFVTLEDPGKNISPHKLRHTFATLLYLNGTDINVLKELLGHADLSSTQIYAAVDQQRRRKAMANHPLLPN